MRTSLTFRKHLLASSCFGLALAIVPAAHGQQAIGEVSAADATVKGSMLLVNSSTRLMSGASLTAGSTTASLRLTRGGEVRVCPRASISLANSQSGRDLLIGMGAGAIETHYNLGSTADTIMTPDFRILLAGPGRFHLAIGADERGNTCVRTLQGDTASIVISEIMGDGVYQILPGEEAYFHGGTIAGAERKAPPDCGCPVAPPTVLVSEKAPVTATQPAPAPAPVAPAMTHPANAPVAEPAKLPANSPEAMIAQHGAASSSSEMVVPSPNGEIHVQVDAPFVYRATEDQAVPPPPMEASLSLVRMPTLLLPPVTVKPPVKAGKGKAREMKSAAVSAKPHKSILGHMRSFFASIFK